MSAKQIIKYFISYIFASSINDVIPIELMADSITNPEMKYSKDLTTLVTTTLPT